MSASLAELRQAARNWTVGQAAPDPDTGLDNGTGSGPEAELAAAEG